MYSEIDENNGLIKVYWQDIRSRVSKVEPHISKIIDSLNPDKSFPLYLAYYRYGSIDADTISTLFPDMMNGFYRLSDPGVPKDVLKYLGYSLNNTPLGMVLDKELECFIDLKNKGITIPWLVYKPGKLFPFSRILNNKKARVYETYGLLTSTAGARSVFMLPNIGSNTNHQNLQRDFNVKSPAPKSLYEHWQIFKEIVNSEVVNSSWRCCVMYFAEKWVTKLQTDKAWIGLKQYLHELAWVQNEYERTRLFSDITFSLIQQKRNLKPNPYLADTARHLFAVALGSAPGFIPILDNQALPISVLQNAFVTSYSLKKYLPTIMTPSHFRFEQDNFPIYYSLQNPSTRIFSPKSREISSTLSELRELEHIMRVFNQELSKEGVCSDTIFAQIAKNAQFNYFHNKPDRHGVIHASDQIENWDSRFDGANHNYKNVGAKFASDATFVRGCISIRRN